MLLFLIETSSKTRNETSLLMLHLLALNIKKVTTDVFVTHESPFVDPIRGCNYDSELQVVLSRDN